MSKNKKRAPKIGTGLLFLAFLAVFAVSAAKVIPYFMESRKAESAYDELRGSFTAKPAKTPEPTKTPEAATAMPVTATPTPEITAIPVTATPMPEITAMPVTATPEPEITATPVAAAPTPEITEMPATATPEPEITEIPVTATPMLEITAMPVAATPEPVMTEEPAAVPAATRTPKAFHTVARPQPSAKPAVQRISMDFEELQKKGKRIVAWISCDDTAIDYPVVHGWNNQYYLDHLWNGEENTHGSIFIDCMNSGKFDERNTVLYGHHMKDGSMFAALDKYKDQSFYEKHPTMTLYTPEGDYIVEIMSGTIEDGNYAFVRFTFQNDEAFTDYAAQLKRRSVFKSDVQAGPTDRLITLCTCSYEENNARFMVTGRLLPIYE